jgi:ABC-type multidrug transport system ATPase subunit/sugar lactone lactonase YvrE
MNGPVWKLNQVTLSGRPRPRLADVSLEIGPGLTAVLGHSGAGKTSLLNLLVGFERPDSGTISESIERSSDRLPLYWCPPGDGLWPHLAAAQHVLAVLPPGSNSQTKTAELLAAFNLADKTGSYPDQLSQGECSRLTLVRAVASDARVLVLDEPLVHVDPAGSRKFWEPLRRYCGEESRTAVVFSTHSPEVVLREAQQVICLSEGRAVYSGSVQQLYYDPPNADLAWCLGPANWIGEGDIRTWLAGHTAGRRCYRPEEVAAQPATDSPLVVKSTSFSGSVAELELLDERTGNTQRVFHRPAGNLLAAGQRVVLHVVALLLVALFLAGCTSASAEPQLSVRTTNSWMLPAEEAKIPTPRALHVGRHEELFVLDNAGRVLVYDLAGKLLRQWWMPDYSVGKPEKIFQLRDDRLVVADTHYHRVVFFDAQGNVLDKRGSLGHGPGEFIYPVAVVEDDDLNYYVCEYGDNDRIQKFDKDGKLLLQIGSFGTEKGQFQRPSGVVWRDHKLYVVDAFNSRIQVFADTGEFLEVLAEGNEAAALNYPYDIAANDKGELFVAEYGAGRVSKFDLSGRLLGRHGTTGSDAGQFFTPWGIAHDGKSRVYVADTGNRRVVAIEF